IVAVVAINTGMSDLEDQAAVRLGAEEIRVQARAVITTRDEDPSFGELEPAFDGKGLSEGEIGTVGDIDSLAVRAIGEREADHAGGVAGSVKEGPVVAADAVNGV